MAGGLNALVLIGADKGGIGRTMVTRTLLTGYASGVVGFRNGLNEAGFVEGRNIARSREETEPSYRLRHRNSFLP
jgi:hypothetical protein